MILELPAADTSRACEAAGYGRGAWWLRIQPEIVQPYLVALGAQVEAVEEALGGQVHRTPGQLKGGYVEVNSARWRWEGDPGQILVMLADPDRPGQPLLEPAGPDDPTPVFARRWIDPPVPLPRELVQLAAALAKARG